MRPDQEKVNEIGNQLEDVITKFMTQFKPTNELLVGMLAGMSHVMVVAAFTVWGPDFGLECITKAVNAAVKKWKESEENGGETETKDRPKP